MFALSLPGAAGRRPLTTRLNALLLTVSLDTNWTNGSMGIKGLSGRSTNSRGQGCSTDSHAWSRLTALSVDTRVLQAFEQRPFKVS